jgi:mRNA interferase YafQ
MKSIALNNKFSKDFSRIARSGGASILAELLSVLTLLATGEPLPEKYKDHPLKNDLKGIRDCHVRPDLVLLYTTTDKTIELIRLGSHSELFR